MPYALCAMPYALCSLPYALSPMPLCSVSYAPCPMCYLLRVPLGIMRHSAEFRRYSGNSGFHGAFILIGGSGNGNARCLTVGRQLQADLLVRHEKGYITADDH